MQVYFYLHDCSVMCVINNYPEEFLRVFDEEGHAVVQFLHMDFDVSGCHLVHVSIKNRKTH